MDLYDLQPLISKQEIHEKVKELGARISTEYAGKDLVLIGVLRGAFLFLADLCREIKLDCRLDFMWASSYGTGTKSSGHVELKRDLEVELEGKHILVVEDVVDSGKTLEFLSDYFKDTKAASFKVCALLDKRNQKDGQELDYCGFEIGRKFVVGYGLDLGHQFRNLPDIYWIEEA